MSQENLLPCDGDVFLIEEALSSDAADRAYADLIDGIDWRQETATLFGRKIPLPRLTAWYGDAAYAYSGIQHAPSPLTDTLKRLKVDAERFANAPFNSVLLNLYRDGRDSMGWHSDDEVILGPAPVIASLSLGGARRFQLKHRQNGDLVSVELTPGSCLIMAGRCQACWRHQVPKTKKSVAPRINLTFRLVQSPNP
ncbi:MAG: alpha-ketoglutarate-dependent dioxygenase AlkB family protein [Geminicoccaceae bacterium]